MLKEGVVVAIVGMTVVFSFLVLMVIAITLTGRFARRFFPEADVRDQRGVGEKEREIAVALAAVKARMRS